MRKLIPLVMAGSLLAAPSLAHSADKQPGVIQVTASATADVAPDLATVMAGVQSSAPTAQDAMARNSEQMRNVFAALTARGVVDRDISTSSLNLSPRYDYEVRTDGQPRLVGYQASNQVTVRSKDLDSVGPLIDALIGAGVNNVNNVSFSVTDADAAQDAARTEAIGKAQAKATSMARAANVQLGRLLSLSEGASPPAFQPYPVAPMMARAEAMDGGPPLAPGEREISATVTMIYAIAD
ncbi:MAG: SIMPL domain-containing protein [Litorimonas sp.]